MILQVDVTNHLYYSGPHMIIDINPYDIQYYIHCTRKYCLNCQINYRFNYDLFIVVNLRPLIKTCGMINAILIISILQYILIKMLVLSILMIHYTRSSTTFFHNNKKITLIS